MIVLSAITCGRLDNILNGGVRHENLVVGSIAAYSCTSGFMLEGNENRVCRADRLWDGTEPICSKWEGGNGLHSARVQVTYGLSIEQVLYPFKLDDGKFCRLKLYTWIQLISSCKSSSNPPITDRSSLESCMAMINVCPNRMSYTPQLPYPPTLMWRLKREGTLAWVWG